jgi:hypothetical protein
MNIPESELRALVRDAIARHAGRPAGPDPDPAAAFRLHVSHGRLPLARGAEDGGACLIEPSVACNHCGYCVSYGH